MDSKIVLNIFNLINKKYKKIYMKITRVSNIYSINNNDDSIDYKLNALDNLSLYSTNKYTYIDTNNELLSNYDSMIMNMFKEIVGINEKICSRLNINNKLKDNIFNFELMFKDKKYKTIFLILLFNFKYLRKSIKNLKTCESSEFSE